MAFFKARVENLEITAHNLVIKPTHFLEPIFTSVSVWGLYTDKPSRKVMNIDMTLLIRSKNEMLPVLMLTGTFIVRGIEDLDRQNTYLKLAQYGFELLGNYVKEHDIKDHSGNPFIIPPFLYSESSFEGVALDE
jgi:hypothetical protein